MIRLLRAAIAAALSLAVSPQLAGAFNPLPRPVPGSASTVCADDATVACDSLSASTCASGTCVIAPASLVPNVEVRGTLTLITDEDVTGWNGGADGSGSRAANARYTVMLQYEKDGTLRTFADTYDLEATSCSDFSPCGDGLVEFELCVPQVPQGGWSQPACEDVITSPQLSILFSTPGAQIAKAVAVDLTGDPNTTAKPFLDVVDRLPGTTSSHAGSDPLASVQQLKVTIRLLP